MVDLRLSRLCALDLLGCLSRSLLLTDLYCASTGYPGESLLWPQPNRVVNNLNSCV